MEEKQLELDLASIRNMMERSSKFISLSGLAGVLAGIYAIIGAAIAYYILGKPAPNGFTEGLFQAVENLKYFIELGLAVLVLSILTGFFLTYQKARRNLQPVWGKTSRLLLFNMSIPLLTGGALVIILLYQGNFGLLLPSTLIFYGLALVNGGNFTFTDVKYLGICDIVLGLIGACFPEYGLLLWTIGFGLLHIIYGSIMYLKYDRESTIR